MTVVVGSLAGGMKFDEVQREYDITADDIRAALRFVGELAEQESFHPLPAARCLARHALCDRRQLTARSHRGARKSWASGGVCTRRWVGGGAPDEQIAARAR
jgi:hypothetical protein